MAETRTAGSERAPAPDGDPPGPDGLPVLGNTLAFLRDPDGFYERLATDYAGDVARYSIAGNDGYMLTHPEDIERVLVTDASDFRRGLVRDTLGQIVDGGLLLVEGETWHRERTALQPAFYRDRIETYAEMMTHYAEARADAWRGRDSVTVSEETRTLTLEILTKTLLDVDIRGQESTIGRAAGRITDRFDAGTVTGFLPLWVPTPRNLRARRAIATFEETIDDIVAARRAEPDDDREDVLSLLLDLELDDGSTLDDADLRDHLFTFLVAGHETTSLSLSYALFLLATHPDEQARLHAELDDVCGDERPTAGDLFELDHLDRVVDEALRLYPPAYTVFREPKTDVRIRGYDVPAGSVLSLPQYVVHRDGRWYDDPDAFRPDRWTRDRDRPEYAYYPFGGGPRHCIGMRFALMETKLVLATLVQDYRFEPVTEPPLDISMQVTLQPADPIEVGLVER